MFRVVRICIISVCILMHTVSSWWEKTVGHGTFLSNSSKLGFVNRELGAHELA